MNTKIKFQSFQVSVSNYQVFQLFKVSKFQRCKSSISCFSIEIDPISKIFKDLLDDLQGSSVPAYSESFKVLDVRIFKIACRKSGKFGNESGFGV